MPKRLTETELCDKFDEWTVERMKLFERSIEGSLLVSPGNLNYPPEHQDDVLFYLDKLMEMSSAYVGGEISSQEDRSRIRINLGFYYCEM